MAEFLQTTKRGEMMLSFRIKRYQLIPRSSEFRSRGERYRFWAFVLGLSFPGYHIGINTMLTSIIGGNSIDTLLAYGILFGAILFSIIKTPRNQWNRYFLMPVMIVIGCLLLLFISSWLHPENARVIQRIRTTFLQTVFWGVFVSNTIDDISLYKRALKLIGYIVFFFLVYEPFSANSTLFIEVDNSWGTTGYLTWGYRMLIAVITLLYSAVENHSLFDWLFAILATVELVVIGNRGSMMAIAVFIVLYVIFCTETRKKYKYLAVISGLCVVIYLAITPSNIFLFENFLAQFGIRSRNVTKILDNTLTDSGRDAGYEIAINHIKSGNMFGLGIGGDQILVGNYPHNIVLELMLQYGNILGIMIFGWLLFQTIKNLLYIKDKHYKAVYIVFFSLGLIKLWLSSTYWYELWFWAYLVIVIKTKKYIKWKHYGEKKCDERISEMAFEFSGNVNE